MWQLFNIIPLLLCDLPLEDDNFYNTFLIQEITAIVFSPFICLYLWYQNYPSLQVHFVG